MFVSLDKGKPGPPTLTNGQSTRSRAARAAVREVFAPRKETGLVHACRYKDAKMYLFMHNLNLVAGEPNQQQYGTLLIRYTAEAKPL